MVLSGYYDSWKQRNPFLKKCSMTDYKELIENQRYWRYVFTTEYIRIMCKMKCILKELVNK